MYVCMYVYMYVCMYVCMYVYILCIQNERAAEHIGVFPTVPTHVTN